jgi:hypothetical protein
MTNHQAAKIEGKRAIVRNVLVWTGAAMGFAALIYCVNGGDPWITLAAGPIGLGLTAGGVICATGGAAADAALAEQQTNAPKPPEPGEAPARARAKA